MDQLLFKIGISTAVIMSLATTIRLIGIGMDPATGGHPIPYDAGYWSRLRNPGNGWCSRCGVSWGEQPDSTHTIRYREDRGCFPTCESCWQQSTIEERLGYARDLVDDWKSYKDIYPYMANDDTDYDEVWRQIEATIRAGG